MVKIKSLIPPDKQAYGSPAAARMLALSYHHMLNDTDITEVHDREIVNIAMQCLAYSDIVDTLKAKDSDAYKRFVEFATERPPHGGLSLRALHSRLVSEQLPAVLYAMVDTVASWLEKHGLDHIICYSDIVTDLGQQSGIHGKVTGVI